MVGGGEGEEESEEMRTASGGFGRRRFDVGCVGRAIIDPSFSKFLASSSSDPVSSMSSRSLFGFAPGKWSRLEREDARCVVGVAFSVACFWVEPKENLGAGVNC